MAQTWQLRRDGLVFDVHDAGPADGEAVVLLHGFPQDSSCWAEVVPRLVAGGARTLALDQRGFSPGARPAGRVAYRASEGAADVVALLDAAGLRSAHVVGHDLGGLVGWLLAAMVPQRVASLTVLSTPHPAAFLQSLPRGLQALRSSYIALFQLPVLPELARHGLGRTLRLSGLPEPYAGCYAQRMSEPGALTAALGWYRAMPLAAVTPGPPVRVPVTYAWGRHDPALGRTAATRTAAFAQGPYRFEALDAGHWLPETRPHQVATLVRDRLAGGARPPDRPRPRS
jgi:pimeloyl-ACP methyl ester carboxylesterase